MLAQTLFEYGLLNAMAAGFATLRYRIEAFLQTDEGLYLLAGLFALALICLSRRRRVAR